MDKNTKALLFLLLAFVAVFALAFISETLTAKPECPPDTFCVSLKKDYAGATATVAALTQEAQ